MWEAMGISLELAGITALLLMLVAIPMAYLLVFGRFRGKTVLEVCIALPIVLPPTVLGYFMLVLMGPQGMVGQGWRHVFDASLAFSFAGMVMASLIYSLPFAVQPIQQAFRAIPRNWIEMAQTQGMDSMARLRRIILPASRSGVVTALALVFAHTMGEFGVVLMVGGSIAGKTKVASIYLFEQVELMKYGQANMVALMLIAIAFVVLSIVYGMNRYGPAGDRR